MNDFYEIPSYKMTLEQARQAVKELRMKISVDRKKPEMFYKQGWNDGYKAGQKNSLKKNREESEEKG